MKGKSPYPSSTSVMSRATESKLYWGKGDLKWNLGEIYFFMT